MLTTRWEPFAEVNRLSRELDRVFGALDLGRNNRQSSFRAYPPINVWQDSDNFYLESELPGFEMEDLDVSVSDNQLNIKGARKAPQLEGGKWLRRERGFFDFQRTVELPTEVDTENVSASLHNGVLTITLGKRPEVKPRRIEIRSHQ
jgi:HSP20 family protein